jgi:AraC-like DNA-binding protein
VVHPRSGTDAVDPDQGSKRTAVAGARISGWAYQLTCNHFDRFELGDGVASWIYQYSNPGPLPIPCFTTGAIEIAVQLEGEWCVEAWSRGAACFARGDVFALPRGLRHTYSFRSLAGDPGLQVGFAIDPQRIEGSAAHRVTCPRMRVEPGAAATWREIAARVVLWRSGRGGLGPPEHPSAIEADVLAAARRECDLLPDAPVLRAAREIDRALDRPLYLAHIAEAAGVHEKTLSRRFIEHCGVAPIRYRTEQRLQRGIRLLWSRPEMSVRGIAAAVGFEDPRFFHRLARATFGMTPAQLGRRPA